MKTGLQRGFPYAKNWAEDVFDSFRISHTRAGNLLFIAASEAKKLGIEADARAVRDVILADLRHRGKQEIWTEFKKAAKGWAFWDSERKRALFLMISKALHGCVVEQAELPWDFYT